MMLRLKADFLWDTNAETAIPWPYLQGVKTCLRGYPHLTPESQRPIPCRPRRMRVHLSAANGRRPGIQPGIPPWNPHRASSCPPYESTGQRGNGRTRRSSYPQLPRTTTALATTQHRFTLSKLILDQSTKQRQEACQCIHRRMAERWPGSSQS